MEHTERWSPSKASHRRVAGRWEAAAILEPLPMPPRCSTWRVIVNTRSNALYDRCATEHGRPRQPSRNRERAGQAGRASSQRAVDPPTLLLTSDDPSRLSPKGHQISVSAGWRPYGGPGRT
jgi:hypothetical protein